MGYPGSRLRSSGVTAMFNRVFQPSTRNRGTSRIATFPAPLKGLIRNQSLALPKGGGAEVLDNFFPTAEGVRLRKGDARRGSIGGASTHEATYSSAGVEKHFATTTNAIYDVTAPGDPDVAPTPLVSGLLSGDWTSVQFASSARELLVMVNGSDPLHHYDGRTFYPVTNQQIFLLDFDAKTGSFTVGETLSGTTSGASALIVGVVDNGTTGTIYIREIANGPFQDNEVVTDAGGGSANANIPVGVEPWLMMTGADTNDLSHVWKFKSRLLFIKRGTTDAYYLPVDAVAGALTKFSLGGVFPSGGVLVSGASWSVNSGGGLEDTCLFFSDKGEVAVYQGSDPSSISTFGLVGVYKIGVPLHKNAMVRAGGDLWVLTDDAVVPLSAMLATTDRSGMKKAAISYPIEELWRQIVNERKGTSFPFTVALWHAETMLVVGVPAFSGLPAYALVCNTRTNAWARYTGWDVRSLAIFDDRLFFGTSTGRIVEGETGGSDQGSNYTGVLLPRFDDFGDPSEKVSVAVRLEARSKFVFTPQLFANSDYEIDLPLPLNADGVEGSNVWDAAIWDESVWGSGSTAKQLISRWESVAAIGHSLSPGLQITSGRTTSPDLEIITLQLMYEPGQVMG